MVNVPYVNLAAQWAQERKALWPIIENVMESGAFVGGACVDTFERGVEAFTGAKHCVALNSGTDALVCGLMALGVGRGDEVITPPNSFIASTAAIAHIGAVPVFADVLANQNIDPRKVEEAITSKTKAIMPVHLTGRMADMVAIMEIAERHGLAVIEDAAQSVGSLFDNEKSGTVGHVGCFSTHPLKNLNACGDGGFMVTNDDAIADKVRSMRNHGLVDRNTVEQFGYVSRMDAMQAAILTHRLGELLTVIQKRRANAALYCELLNASHLFVPEDDPREFNTYHTFVVQLDHREELRAYLDDRGIQTAIHYPVPIHLQPAAAALGHSAGDFPVTEEQARRILTLPVHQFLTETQVRFVADTVNEFFGG